MPSVATQFVRRWGESDRLVGVAVVGVVLVVLATFAYLYAYPPSQKDLEFRTQDASVIGVGEAIRVAGIDVGKVTEVALGGDSVTVKARIDSSTFLGDHSRVEVRMLTPVGGYAISVISLGDTPLEGDIPIDRVRVPYTIGDVLQSVPSVTDRVDAPTVHANLDQLSEALQGNSDSLRSMVNGLDSVAGVLDQQRDQVRTVADLASEYLQQLNQNRDFVFALIDKIDQVAMTYHINHAGFNRAFDLFGDWLARITPLMRFYLDHSPEIGQHVQYLRDLVARMQQSMGGAIDGLMALRARLLDAIGPGNSAVERNWTSTVCIPVPGQEC